MGTRFIAGKTYKAFILKARTTAANWGRTGTFMSAISADEPTTGTTYNRIAISGLSVVQASPVVKFDFIDPDFGAIDGDDLGVARRIEAFGWMEVGPTNDTDSIVMQVWDLAPFDAVNGGTDAWRTISGTNTNNIILSPGSEGVLKLTEPS